MTTRKVVCTSQPQGAVSIDWSNPLNEGLVLAQSMSNTLYDGFSRRNTVVGTKKQVANVGLAAGFGSLGLGSTDSITTSLKTHATQRTYFVIALATGTGAGNGSGRLIEKRTAGAQSELLYRSESTNRFIFGRAFSGGGGEWYTTDSALGVYHEYAVRYDSSSASNTPLIDIDGISQSVAVFATPSGSPVNTTDSYVIGNRTNDNARNWSGSIALVLIWDRLLSDAEIASVSTNPYQIFQPQARPIFTSVAPAAAIAPPAQIDKTLATFSAVASASAQTAQIDKSLTASVAPASATGSTAIVSKTTVVFCTVAPSVAAGVTCSLSGGVSISCASAQAAATAHSAQIDLSLNGSVSQASAVGVTARTNKSLILGLAQATALGTTARRNDGLACGVGAATAQGVTCATNGAATITCSVGDSAAAAPSAQVDKSLLAGVGSGAALGIGTLLDKSTLTLVAPASARGTTAYADISVITVAAPASAAGITIPVSGAVTITTIAASASANGVTENISTGTSCSVANAGAAGVTAVLQTGVVISASVAAAIAAGITSQIDKAINAAATSAFAAGVTASIVVPGNETIGCSRALASAKGVTSIVSFTIIITFDVENIQLVSDLCLSSSSLSPISKSVVFQSKLIN